MLSFTYNGRPSRVIFGSGTLSRLPEEVERLDLKRVLVLATPPQRQDAERLAASIGDRCAGVFAGAVMHTPVGVTDEALELVRRDGVDGLVAVGGGSTTGLAKAIALRTDLPQIVAPTTYAGSEMTPILGETKDGRKVTQSSPKILPEIVIYDVDLTLTLPAAMSGTSGMNAIAHAIEALYAKEGNPITELMALEAIGALYESLPVIAREPSDRDARAKALYGAWLCGICLGSVGMALHHKLCHTLGGMFDLPHAETHTIVLPQALAYNAPAIPEVMDKLRRRLRTHRSEAGTPRHRDAGGGRRRGDRAGSEQSLLEPAAVATRRVARPDRASPLGRGAPRGGLIKKEEERPMSEETTVTPKAPEYPYFEEHLSEEVVNARMGDDIDPRLREVMEAVVRHLHAAVKEIEPTHDEWMKAIRFLTDVGHMCTDWRQEFILLSDILGVSMLVDSINHRRPSGATENTILGPFYVPEAPRYAPGTNICLDGKGEPMVVRGRVVDTDGNPVAGALVDVWQTNDDGFYDVQQKGVQPDWNLRGVFTTDKAGEYWFRTSKPRYYPIPDDGPVGKLLGALGRHPNRSAHIHFIVSAEGYDPVITHIFSPDCEYLDQDAVFGVKDSLIAEFHRVDDEDEARRLEFASPFWTVDWNFVLANKAAVAQ